MTVEARSRPVNQGWDMETHLTDQTEPDSPLERYLRLLEIIAAFPDQLALADVAALSDLPKTTAHRLLKGLVKAELASGGQGGSTAALFGDAMLAAAERRPGGSLAGASPVQAQALVALMTEPRYAALRHASGLDGLLDGVAERARQRGRELGQTLLVRHITDAFLTCHIPVKLLY